MKEIKIKELVVNNFRGQNFHDKYGMNENQLSGKNGSGKSTRFAAWLWLISGRTDANSPANHLLFDNRVELSPNTPTAKVEAIVSIDGETYKIRREATASFQRKRGTSDYIKSTSDSYKFFIDDIERGSGDFKEWISENLCDADLITYSLSGDFFINRLYNDKKGCRQLIERLVGNVERSEMKGDYSIIDELLQRYTLSEIDERATNLAKGINQRLNEIPSLITNIEREISEIEQTDFNAIEFDIKQAENERERLDKELLDLSERMKPQMEAKYKAQSEKRMKQEMYDKALSDFIHEKDAEIARLKDEISAVQKQNKEIQRNYENAVNERDFWTRERDNAINNLKIAEQRYERLHKERDEEKAKTIDPNATKCPNCGAELTGDKLQQVIDRFERIKRERIDAIVVEGRATADEIKHLEQIAIDAQPKIDVPLPEVINQSTTELESRITYLAGHVPTKEDFDNTDQGKALLAAITAVEIPEVVMPDDSEIKTKKTEVNAYLVPLYEKRGLKARAETLRKQIDRLRIEQTEKGAELAMYERQRQLVKNYKQEQMEILSHKVNDGLRFSRIEVWSQQKDGQIVGDLVIKDALGVNFACTNNASRIVTTVDIQRFFCDKLGVNMPVFVDECSVLDSDNLPLINNVQMFYLFRADSALHIETR